MIDLRRRATVLVLVAAVLTGCDSMSRAGVGPDARRELAFGRDAAATWIAIGRDAPAVDAADAIAVGYLERLRLGFGSPFRLIDHALRDPRLDDDTRRRLAWALLAGVIDGASYQLDPAALDRVGLAWQDIAPGTGRHHVRLIEQAIRDARDPRGGELAVRLGYELAAAEGSVSTRAPAIAAQAASLVRDRAIARADALHLLRMAEVKDADPLVLLARWRVERRFEVEQPPLAAVSQEIEREAIEAGPRLARSLRSLTPKLEGSDNTTAPARPASLLGPAAARRLLDAADSLNMPPQTPVAIALRTHRRELLERPSLDDAQRAQRTRFVERAVTEEHFVGEYALLPPAAPRDLGAPLAALTAAVALRAYAQEAVWFPGSGGPTSRELEERFGLASVRFAEAVPAEWRPYYRRMLESALVDLYRVLPALDLRGLAVRFGETESADHALALHDPRERRISLPPLTSAGTIAHEVAHDLDWQVARRRYRVRGDYASDHAVRLQQPDRLAVWVNHLSAASLGAFAPSSDRVDAHWRRPAEVFARNIDWFVAVSLAAEGRMNGYLTSVQDDVLTGYGTVRSPDVTGAAGNALLTILDEVAPVYPATRDWFVRSYGTQRSLTAFDLVRRIVETPLAPATGAGSDAVFMAGAATLTAPLRDVERALQEGFSAIDEWVCRAPGAAYDFPFELARRQLVVEAAAARARGMAIAQAREIAGQAGARWLARRFYGTPWAASHELDPALAELLEPLVAAVAGVAAAEMPAATSFGLVSPPSYCAAAPLRLIDVARAAGSAPR